METKHRTIHQIKINVNMHNNSNHQQHQTLMNKISMSNKMSLGNFTTSTRHMQLWSAMDSQLW